VPDFSTPRPVTADDLPSGWTDDERASRLADLRNTEEIVGIEADFLALVEQGANLTPWRARKSAAATPNRSDKAMADQAIPATVSETVDTVLGTALDNLTAIRGQVAENTEGVEGAPPETGEALPEEILEALRGEISTLQAMVDEYGAEMPAPEEDPAAMAAAAAAAAAEGEPKPEDEDEDEDKPGATMSKQEADSILAKINAERIQLVTAALAAVAAAVQDGSMTAAEISAKIGAIHDQLWKLDGDLTALAKSITGKATETRATKSAKESAEALDGVADLRKEFEAFKTETDTWAESVQKTIHDLAGLTTAED